MAKLESGNTYKITDLFTDNRHIIIPDLQRDYCWGDKRHGDNNNDLVTAFLQNLKDIFKEDRHIKLGMIYAYEYPLNSNRIYLCDGQQRITTLFLLLGIINRQFLKNNIANKDVRKCLISELELNDDKEPRLLYAIRESTLYFLSDLVCNFFLKDIDYKVSDIKKQSWYFREYNLDPTIQSMISAMEIIENEIENYDDFQGFAEYILNKISFFYFDMKNRETGEDMFVVINTTGEPLTSTENIKPLLIGNIINEKQREEASNTWEKWEKYFWENRSEKEHEADNGLNKFFIFYWQIKLLQEKQWKDKKSFEISPFQLFSQTSEIKPNEENTTSILSDDLNKIKSISEIDRYFNAYKNLYFEISQNALNRKIINDITDLDLKKPHFLRDLPINIILPLIQFKVKYPEGSIYFFLRRLRKNFFDQKWETRKNNYVDWRHVLQLIDKSDNIDNLLTYSEGFNFKEIPNIPNNVKKWFNTEEKLKAKLKEQNSETIESWEDSKIFMGDISFLFQVFLKRNEGITNNFSNLNKEFTDITITDTHFDYLQKIKMEELQHCMDTYNNMTQNPLFKVLEIRFNRVNHLWAGNWSFGRDYFDYKRWHKKHTRLIYQSWVYYIICEILNNEANINKTLKTYIQNIFSQSSKMFFETDLALDGICDFKQLELNLENKSKSENNNGFYHWNGFLWHYLLAIYEPAKKIDFEIIFDLFDRKKNRYKIGNQFIWTKDYYDKKIKTFDLMENSNWLNWQKIKDKEPELQEAFVNQREEKIKFLYEKSFDL
jgi:hypothetical protein